ncbi:TonB-dependent receptor plug domain-containing protein [Flavobacterium flavigenum]|uniref:TonB-dependent receptor plug domain-containing protein n=1 Tax=Flavobacterium flavigenum TaxID=3003258 RepID=UPI0022ABD502|nr:TonB-dependent receptor plug domain-containing protein [Flavobacterium flavigenum]
MKNVKLISLALSMLISFVLKAQGKTVTRKHENNFAKTKIVPKTFIKSKDTISDIKVSSNCVKPTVSPNQIRICVPSRSLLKEPLYILDGEIINSSQFSKINPSDIEEIKVLKGNDATLIYGNHGINGVIVIISKEK